jgi:hypothetical protein
MTVFARALAVFFALGLAGAFIPLAANLVFRVPDLYSFDLGRTQSTAEIGVNVSDSRVADAISSFMRHKTDSFQVGVKQDSTGVSLFTGNDGAVMTTLRSFLDNICVIGFTSFALFIALSVMLVRWDRPRELRLGFTGGLVIYGALICFTAFTIVFGGPGAWIWTDVIGAGFTPADTMPKLFHSGFFLLAWIAITVITLVIVVILFSVVRRLTRHERMFLGKE